MKRRALFVLPIVVGLIAAAGPATSAPPASPPPAPAAAPAAAPVRALNPALVTRLAATKRQVDPAALNQAFVKSGQTTSLRLKKNNRLIPLDPLKQPVPLTPALRTASTPPAALSKYKAYYESPSVEPLKNTPTLVALKNDHSARQTPIKDQKSRGSCVAFALSAGMESFLKWKTGNTYDISEEHMFHLFKDSVGSTCNAYGFWYADARPILFDKKICNEVQEPYAAPSDCVISTSCTSGAAFHLKEASLIPYTESQATIGWEPSNTNLLEAYLDLGYDVQIGMGVAGTDWSDSSNENGVIDVQMQYGKPVAPYGGHALNIYGYDRAGGYFMVKNSWGTDWGRAGFVRITYDYMQTYANEALIIMDAEHTPPLRAVAPAIAPAHVLEKKP